jgi:transposase
MTNGIRHGFEAQVAMMEAIGLDLADKKATFVVVDAMGNVCSEGNIALTEQSLQKAFARRQPTRIALEVGTHSPWVSRLLDALGHEVIVANARQVKLIRENRHKNDREDAMILARLARLDPALLKPIRHRGPQAQADLALLRARDGIVRTRVLLINLVRGQVKSLGGRIPTCSTAAFATKARAYIPEELQPGLLPTLDLIAQITQQIKASEKALEQAASRYPEVKLLRQVKGVGPITALAYVLVIEEPQRFTKSRGVGAFVGLTTRQSQSGEQEPQLHITKAGDELLRRLIVQSAQYILGPFGPDCDLRRWGLKLAGDGSSKIRKRKAVIAVARKLTVLLHRLWVHGLVYEPLHADLAKLEVAA